VRELFELYASGMYATAIIKLFNSKGYLTQQGKEWTCDQIRRTLRHKVYIGYIYDGHRKWYKGTHEPIVSEETFEKANEKFRQRRDNRVEKGIVSTPKQTTYLGGFLRCAHCGALYGKNLSNHGKYRYSYYSCYSRLKKNPLMVKDPNCMNKHWKMTDLESVIFAEIEKLTLEDVRKIREKRTEKEKIDTTLPINKRIKDIDGQISRFLDLYGKGTIDFELLDERIRQLEAEKTKLSAQIPARSASNSPEESEVINLIKSFPEAVRKGSLDEIRGLLSVLIDKIELDGEDVRIFWRF
jgi:site-specific DNA recombinase